MNVTLTIQDITPRELSALMGALAAMPAPEPEPAFRPASAPGPAPAAPTVAPAPKVRRPKTGKRSSTAVVATHTDGTEHRFGSIREASEVLGMNYKTVFSALSTGGLASGSWRFRRADAPESAPDSKPTGPTATAKQRLLEQQAERQRKEEELAAVMVTSENGIREPLGKALERLQEEKKHHHRQQPVAGRHDDGDIKWWPSRTDAARDLAVTPEHVGKCIKECRKLRGWMLEDDNQEKGGAR